MTLAPTPFLDLVDRGVSAPRAAGSWMRKRQATGLWSEVVTSGSERSSSGVTRCLSAGIDFQSTRSQYDGMRCGL